MNLLSNLKAVLLGPFMGPVAFRGFIEKYFGAPSNIKDIGDGTVTDAIKTLNDSLGDVSGDLENVSESVDLISTAKQKGFINTATSDTHFAAIKFKTYGDYTVPVIQIDNTSMQMIGNRVETYPIVGFHVSLEGSTWYLYVTFHATGSLHAFKVALSAT